MASLRRQADGTKGGNSGCVRCPERVDLAPRACAHVPEGSGILPSSNRFCLLLTLLQMLSKERSFIVEQHHKVDVPAPFIHPAACAPAPTLNLSGTCDGRSEPSRLCRLI